MPSSRSRVAIVDYGMGNLYSVRLACARVGMDARITSLPREVAGADAVILPGVGAFGDAMQALRRSGMDVVLREAGSAGKPVLGICLGMQLLLSESLEFGQHAGLGLVPGRVVRLAEGSSDPVKVPHIAWNQVWKARFPSAPADGWHAGLAASLPDGAFMYFVHSFHAVPEDPAVVFTTTRYGENEFCSSLRAGNILACQFHPERSGDEGLLFYQELARHLACAPR